MPKIAFTADKVVAFVTALLFFLIPLRIGIGLTVFTSYFVFFVLWKHKHIPFIQSPILYGMGFLLLGFLSSSFFSASPENAFLDWHSPKYFALPFLLLIFCADKEPGYYLKYLLWAGIPFAAYMGLAPFFTGETLHFPPYFGETFLLLFCITLPFGLIPSEKRGTQIAFLSFSLSCGVFIMSTQDAYLRLCLLYAILLIMTVKLPRKLFLGLFAISFLVMLGLAHKEHTQPLAVLLTEQGHSSEDFMQVKQEAKRIYFEAGSMILTEHPFLGVGANQTDVINHYLQKSSASLNVTKIPAGDFHNLFMNIWIKYGLLGLAGLLFWWGSLLFQALQLASAQNLSPKELAMAHGTMITLSMIFLVEYFHSNFSDPTVQVIILSTQGLFLSLLWNKKGRPDRL